MHHSDPLPRLLTEYRRAHALAAGSFQQLEIAARKFATWHTSARGRNPALADLTQENLHDWMDFLQEAGVLAASTINSKRTAVLTLANWAADRRPPIIPALPKVKRLVEGRDPPTGWSLEEFSSVLWSARLEGGDWDGLPAGEAWYFGLLMIWDSGARFRELWNARVEHVDLERRAWLVPADSRKGRRQGRVYRLAEDTCAAIAATLSTPRRRLWPFPSCRRQVWRHWDRILARAGLPANRRSKWHCVRRTAESHAALSRGIEWAAEAVGHSPAVARAHYLVPTICAQPSLSDALPRPSPGPRLTVVG